MIRFLVVLSTIFLIMSCGKKQASQSSVKTGFYRAIIEIQGKQLPFNFELINTKGGGYHAYILNAGERLLLDEVSVSGDSIDLPLHIFDANIKAKVDGDSLYGKFIKNYDKDFRIPFKAKYGQKFRFEKSEPAADTVNFSGKYEVTFIDDKDTTDAIGVFHQVGDSVTGTFLTTTGDYRYLQGNVSNRQMQLSTFDGNHAYLFTALKTADGNLSGDHYSGKSYHATWTGVKNKNAALPDAESLTYLKPGFDKIEFSFPDVDGKKISLSDEKYKGKVVIIQLFGTWCPNCMDETKFLAPWYDENKNRGVEIIGLAYERKDDFSYASGRLKKMIDKLNVHYDFAIGGVNDKVKAGETLPMLNKVVAFPTTIFVGKDGKVKKIHTGFSGPGTGIYYEQFVEHFNELVNEMLNAKSADKI
jgi:thiol-disulfide isomerase/thioredoxin